MAPKLHLYRPQRAEPELLEKITVGREPLLREILGRLERWQPRSSRQHDLFIGPRGIGKTHLLCLVKHRVRSDPALREKWVPIHPAEDFYGVSRVSDLLVEALRRLAEEPDAGPVPDVYEDLRYDDDDDRIRDRCLDAFRRFHRDTGRGVLLLLENLDRLLERQVRRRHERHRLRKILSEEDYLVALCTSPTFLNAVSRPEEPFFEFFRVHALAEMTGDEQEEMFHRLAAVERSPELLAYLKESRPRLRALYHFTGGNPRLAVMLYDLVAHFDISGVRNELDLLLDQLTPFYQDRMKEIPEQEAKVLETMALLTEGATPTELAREARLDAKIVRATLTRLERAGYVRREQRRRKRTVYIVPERLFRIWHQMNHSRAARGRVRYLLEFFASWYATREERDRIWDELAAVFEHAVDDERLEDAAEYMDYILAISEGDERLMRIFQRLQAMVKAGRSDAVEEELAKLDREFGKTPDYLRYKSYFLANVLQRPDRDRTLARVHARILGWATARTSRERAEDLAQEVMVVCLENYSELERPEDLVPVAFQIAKYKLMNQIRKRLRRREDQQQPIDELFSMEDKGPGPEQRVLWRERWAALLGSTSAVEPVLLGLDYPDAWVRASAATALGRLGSASAVEPLIRALEDPAPAVSSNAAASLGRLIDQLTGPQLEHVSRILIESAIEPDEGRFSRILPSFLRASFRTGDADAIRKAIEMVSEKLATPVILTPYKIAAEYLSSGRDPAILERQHPEMREAVLLLVPT